MIHYCRYCAECIAQDDDWGVCQARNFETVKSTSKREKCEHFNFNEIDAFDLNRIYKPRESGKRNKQLDGQISLFDRKETP